MYPGNLRDHGASPWDTKLPNEVTKQSKHEVRRKLRWSVKGFFKIVLIFCLEGVAV